MKLTVFPFRKLPLAVACALMLILYAGCRRIPDTGIQSAPAASLQAVIAETEESIGEWERRLSSGEWSRMVADGSWRGYVVGDAEGIQPASYPQQRIAELREKINTLREALEAQQAGHQP